MAKGKHSAALFEVIHSDKRFRTKAATPGHGSLKTPKWWFKSRDKADESAPKSGSEPTPAELAADPTLAALPASTEPASKPVKLFPERNEISFKLTYTTAIIGAFSVIVIVGLAYMIGTRGKPSPAVARAGQSTENLLKHPAQTGVLNLDAKPKDSATASKISTISNTAAPKGDAGTRAGAPPVQQPPQPPPLVEEDGFTIGRNYVIAQSYPDEASAKRAAEIILKGGMQVRVVRGPKKHANANWFSVVGTRGFDRISGTEYTTYVQKMIEAGAPLMKNSRFEQLKPATHKWVGDYGLIPLDPPAGAAAPRR